MTIVVEGRNIVRDYHVPGGLFRPAKTIHAVKGVSFSVEKGRTLAIVGESGCGEHGLQFQGSYPPICGKICAASTSAVTPKPAKNER